MADAPSFGYIPQLNRSAHVSISQYWSIDMQLAVLVRYNTDTRTRADNRNTLTIEL